MIKLSDDEIDNYYEQLVAKFENYWGSTCPIAIEEIGKLCAQAKLANKSGGAEAVAGVPYAWYWKTYLHIKSAEYTEHIEFRITKPSHAPDDAIPLYAHPSVAGMPDEPHVLFERWWNGDDAPDLTNCTKRDAAAIGFSAGISIYLRAIGGA